MKKFDFKIIKLDIISRSIIFPDNSCENWSYYDCDIHYGRIWNILHQMNVNFIYPIKNYRTMVKSGIFERSNNRNR